MYSLGSGTISSLLACRFPVPVSIAVGSPSRQVFRGTKQVYALSTAIERSPLDGVPAVGPCYGLGIPGRPRADPHVPLHLRVLRILAILSRRGSLGWTRRGRMTNAFIKGGTRLYILSSALFTYCLLRVAYTRSLLTIWPRVHMGRGLLPYFNEAKPEAAARHCHLLVCLGAYMCTWPFDDANTAKVSRFLCEELQLGLSFPPCKQSLYPTRTQPCSCPCTA